MSSGLKLGKPLKRKNSLECSCESIKIMGNNRKFCNRCDFCSEKLFLKSMKVKSSPSLSLLN